MIDFIVADSLEEAEAIVAKMDFYLGYPNERVKTVTYAEPYEHTGMKGRYLVPIKEVGAPNLDIGNPKDDGYVAGKAPVTELDKQLTISEKNKKKDYDVLKAEGAFSVDLDGV